MNQNELNQQLESYGDNTSWHFTREPWWVVVVATVATAILPIWKAGQFRQAFPGVGMIQGMCMWGAMGFVASTVLVLRSRVRSPFWANFLLWSGILAIVLGICFLSLLL